MLLALPLSRGAVECRSLSLFFVMAPSRIRVGGHVSLLTTNSLGGTLLRSTSHSLAPLFQTTKRTPYGTQKSRRLQRPSLLWRFFSVVTSSSSLRLFVTAVSAGVKFVWMWSASHPLRFVCRFCWMFAESSGRSDSTVRWFQRVLYEKG